MKKVTWLGMFLMIIAGCIGVEKESEIKVKNKMNISPELQDIIRMGTLAPSSHNAQMWKIKIINENEVLVLWDKNRKLESSDPQNREALISIGAFIENFVEGAKKYNYEVEVKAFDSFGEDNSVAKLILNKKEFENTENIIKNIEERHSVKTLFLKEDLKSKDISEILDINKSNVTYYDLESEKGKYLKESVYKAFEKEAIDKGVQDELAKWIRLSDKEAKEKKDGMSAEMMGMGGIKKYFYYPLVTEKTIKSNIFVNSGIKVAKKQTENCSGYLVVKSSSNSISDLIDTGRTMEKILLKANELKIAVHPMSAVLHVEPWKDEISGKLGLTEPVQMVLRVGYVKEYGEPTSLRRDIWDIIVE
jgi:nitroreductase